MLNLDPVKLLSDMTYLQELKGLQAWHIYTEYLEMMGEDQMHMLAGTQDPLDRMRYTQGIIAGLKLALEIPEKVSLLAKQANGEMKQPGSKGIEHLVLR